jgi:MoxR-like ATPase
VLLIDEIDKADSDVPNGLLEALGNGQFTPLGRREPVVCQSGIPPPLVIVTTNEERALPDAFLRRCLVLQLKLPAKRAELETFLTERGRHHFPAADAKVIATAVALLVDQRAPADGGPPPIGPLPRPGQAEFLDLLRAVVTRRPNDPAKQLEFLAEIEKFALEKQPDAVNG